MSFLTANPDVDRLASKALQTTLSQRLPALPAAQPPQLDRPFGAMESSPAYYLGERLSSVPERHALLAPFGRYFSAMGEDDSRPAALLGAAVGGVAGAGLGYLRGGNPLVDAGIGAGIGGLGSYAISNLMSHHRHNQAAQRAAAMEGEQEKAASFYAMGDNGGQDLQSITMKLSTDSDSPWALKAELTRLLQNLDARTLAELHSLVRTSAGAGIGFLIARYLLGMGVGGSVLMSLIGGGIGAMSGGSKVNAFGQRTNTTRNIFGEQRLV